MAEENLFADNAAYDRAVGRWSRVAGEVFLDWLGLPDGLSWLDVGCGTGAFTELVLIHNAPSEINGIDPSEGQIAFARQGSLAGRVAYRQGDATSMPYSDDTFDVAIMALVVQYVADPPKAISEIIRVVRQGGTTAAYVWTVSPCSPLWPPSNRWGSRNNVHQVTTCGRWTHLPVSSLRQGSKTLRVARSIFQLNSIRSTNFGPPRQRWL